jgi:signal transduction histidine kinase
MLLFDETAKQKNISIQKSIKLSKPVLADRNMLFTVIRNLISNAIKYSNVDGIINITAEENKGVLDVSVSDNGVGMEYERIQKLFQLNEIYSTLGTEREKGTGLGLILCKEFIEKHNGKIWVESTIDKGSIINFSIPIS